MEIAAIIFVLVTLAIAYVIFRVLKKTVKLMIRAIVFLIIVAVAIAGGMMLWYTEADASTAYIHGTTR